MILGRTLGTINANENQNLGQCNLNIQNSHQEPIMQAELSTIDTTKASLTEGMKCLPETDANLSDEEKTFLYNKSIFLLYCTSAGFKIENIYDLRKEKRDNQSKWNGNHFFTIDKSLSAVTSSIYDCLIKLLMCDITEANEFQGYADNNSVKYCKISAAAVVLGDIRVCKVARDFDEKTEKVTRLFDKNARRTNFRTRIGYIRKNITECNVWCYRAINDKSKCIFIAPYLVYMDPEIGESDVFFLLCDSCGDILGCAKVSITGLCLNHNY